MKRKFLTIYFLSLLLIPCTANAGEYSLDDLYRLALKRNETIKIAEEDLFISKRTKEKARSVLMPTLSAFGTHTRYLESKESNFAVVQPETRNEWGLRLDQSFSLSGRELTAFRIAKEGIKRSRHDLNAVREEYLLNVASSYFDVLKAKKALDIADANVRRLVKHRNAAETRLRVGQVTKTALLRAEAELAGARSELIRSENAVKLSRAVLARTVGLEKDFTLKEPEMDKDLVSQEQEALDQLIGDCRASTLYCLKERAFAERAEVKTASVRRQIAEYEVKHAKGKYWPDLAIEGVYSRQENDPSTSFGLDETTYGALKLEFPFFEGGLRVAEVGEAKARLRQSEHNLEDVKNSIGVEVEDVYLNMLTTSAVLDQLLAEIEYARENYNTVAKQFQHGLADSIDVIDANTLLVTAEREAANAKYDYQLAILGLKRTTGVLLKTVIGSQAMAVNTSNGE